MLKPIETYRDEVGSKQNDRTHSWNDHGLLKAKILFLGKESIENDQIRSS